MENRILIIGDELFGEHGEAAVRCSEMLLCVRPNRPMQFSLNAPCLTSMGQLMARASSDIIGKRAGRTVFGLGYGEMLIARGDGRQVAETYGKLVDEILNKTVSEIHLITVPRDFLPAVPDQVDVLNESIRGFAGMSADRIHVDDFDAHVEVFKKKQLERGKFARSLFSDDAKPTSLYLTLLSLFMQDCILKVLK